MLKNKISFFFFFFLSLQLDITIDDYCLIDQFEWDINDEANSPELFAEKLVTELGIANDFKFVFFCFFSDMKIIK